MLLSQAVPVLAGSPAQARVEGRVYDGNTFRPVAGAVVTWGKTKARTDSAGAYSLSVPMGVRRIEVSGPGAVKAQKLVFLRTPAEKVTLDFILSAPGRSDPVVLALDRGLPLNAGGRNLATDLKDVGALTVADAFGNGDRPVRLGRSGSNAHGAVWLERGRSILWGFAALARDKKSRKKLGIYRHELESGKSWLVAGGSGIRTLALSPNGTRIAAADDHAVFLAPARTDQSGALQRLFGLGAGSGAILSVAWGTDGRIYFTVEDRVAVDAQRSFSRSRIASIRPDGNDYQPEWQAAPDASFRYPFFSEDGEAFFGRFALDGSDQALWRRKSPGPGAVKVQSPALRAVGSDSRRGWLYYIYRNNLYLKVPESDAAFAIAQSVEQADCRP